MLDGYGFADVPSSHWIGTVLRNAFAVSLILRTAVFWAPTLAPVIARLTVSNIVSDNASAQSTTLTGTEVTPELNVTICDTLM
jgi:hypothetical protein